MNIDQRLTELEKKLDYVESVHWNRMNATSSIVDLNQDEIRKRISKIEDKIAQKEKDNPCEHKLVYTLCKTLRFCSKCNLSERHFDSMTWETAFEAVRKEERERLKERFQLPDVTNPCYGYLYHIKSQLFDEVNNG